MTALSQAEPRKTRRAPTRSASAEKATSATAYPSWKPVEIDPAAVADISHCVRSTGSTAAYVMNTDVMQVRAMQTASSQPSSLMEDRRRPR